jgi:3-methylcrotonyl-CoA carboxylase alpha subunit
MEARLYAENPANGFLPCTGPLKHFRLPQGVRIDSGVEEGGEISSFYDPLIAKIIATASTRTAAAERLAEACSHVEVWPLRTNAGFLARALADPDFLAADIDTSFIENRLDRLIPPPEPSEEIVRTAASARLAREHDLSEPWRALEGFRLNAPPHIHVSLQSGGARYQVESDASPAAVLPARDFADAIVVFAAGESYTFTDPELAPKTAGASSSHTITSPLPGRIAAVHVRPGDRVAKGQPLVIVEAMKIEHALRAPCGGIVSAVSAVEGHHVSEGVVLARINPEG